MYLVLYLRYPFEKFIKGGFFSNPKYQTQHVELCIVVNLLSGLVTIMELNEEKTERGLTYFGGDIAKAMDQQLCHYEFSLFDLGLFETVDAHQWNGWPKDDVRDANGRTILKTPTMWEVAGVNTGKDQRVMVARTTAGRDEVFKLNTRLNKFFGFCQNVLAPFDVQLAEMRANKYENLDQMPVGTTDEMAHIFNDIAEAFDDPNLEFKNWSD